MRAKYTLALLAEACEFLSAKSSDDEAAGKFIENLRKVIEVILNEPRLLSASAGLECDIQDQGEWAERWLVIVKTVIAHVVPFQHSGKSEQQLRILNNTWMTKAKGMTVEALKSHLADAGEAPDTLNLKKEFLVEKFVACMGAREATTDQEKANAWKSALDTFVDKALRATSTSTR
jgi:hypothetical protein